MKTVLWAMVMAIGLAPRPADACAVKSNDIAIVVGVVGAEVATLRIDLSEGERAESMTDTEWRGDAMLVVGGAATPIGRIDPTRDPNVEIDRLTTVARDRAKKLANFVAATQVDQTDCIDAPANRCGGASLKGKTLRVGKTETVVHMEGKITGVVRYRAGETEISVVNIGTGDPRFSTGVRPCNAQGCRQITTLHHGDQKDIVVVTRRGA